MSVIFAIPPLKENSNEFDPSTQTRTVLLENCPEICDFLKMLTKNAMSSICIFIPFRSINEYLDSHPMTTLLFIKHDMNINQPICYHLVYRENSANKVDTFKTIIEANARLDEITSRDSYSRIFCQFEERENKEYNVTVREVFK